MASGNMTALIRQMSAGDAIVVGSGADTIVIQVKKAGDSTIRLCVMAPEEKKIAHARHGELITSKTR